MQGGVVENILVENITATNTGNAIFMRIGQIRGAKHPGKLRNIVLRKIKVQVPNSSGDYFIDVDLSPIISSSLIS